MLTYILSALVLVLVIVNEIQRRHFKHLVLAYQELAQINLDNVEEILLQRDQLEELRTNHSLARPVFDQELRAKRIAEFEAFVKSPLS